MSPERASGPVAEAGDSGERFKHEIAADVAISGRISFPGNARIDGRLTGEVRADALLVVGPTAHLRADVRAQSLVLFGTIEGSVCQSDSVELKPGSRLIGGLEAERVVVHAGALFEGRCSIGKRSPAMAAAQSARHAKAREA
ncbi:MAG: polymer-forming cytoskeletal protein [Deltaproteobacteria bacterium]|nr:polymer-forming cytoskeletal protein [Deltaproteobacteria bacterium]